MSQYDNGTSVRLPEASKNPPRENIGSWWSYAKFTEKLVVIVGILYIVSPVDLIPEALLGPLGLLDDVGAIVMVVRVIMTVTERYSRARSVNR